ncbi:unnamed protein product [Urochloa humidicola]
MPAAPAPIQSIVARPPRLQPPASDAGDSSPICILPRLPAPGQERRSGRPPGTSSGVNACQEEPVQLRRRRLGADLVGSVARHGGCNRRARRCSGSLNRLGNPVFRSARRHPLLPVSRFIVWYCPQIESSFFKKICAGRSLICKLW